MEKSEPSIVLQSLLKLTRYYLVVWLLLEALTFVWKGYALPANDNFAIEWLMLALLLIVEVSKVHWGVRGNLLQEQKAFRFSLLFSFASLVGYLYFLLWQTYVLRIEATLAIIGVTLTACTIVMSLVGFVNTSKEAA
eukprot:m.73028 g.73028  ORF g.73028 m.73028 type:complete len:137 (+) comp14302_c0_seq1:66-476(+)